MMKIVAWVTIHAMLIQMASLILQVIVGMLAGTCLLRLYMQWHRIPLAAKAGNPLGPFIFALTNWLVLPLRRILPALGRLDTASAVAAYLVVLGKIGLMILLGMGGGEWWMIMWVAFLDLLGLCLSGLFGLVLVHVVLSWVRTDSPMADWVDRMVLPLLWPLRRILPTLGGIDLSPLVLLLLIQLCEVVLRHLQYSGGF
jgi:YggT family protein